MVRLCLGVCAVALLVGCSTKREENLLQSYTQKIAYHKHLQYTEKAELYDGDNAKVMVTATYLFRQNFEKNDKRPETFIVGVAFDDTPNATLSFDANNIGKTYTLTLNHQSAQKVQELALNDKRLKGISFVNEWGSYYEVTFAHVNSKRFSLLLEHPRYGKKRLAYAKVAKFVYTKKSF